MERMGPAEFSYVAFVLFFLAGYLAWCGLDAAGSYEDRKAAWLMRAAGILALLALLALCNGWRIA